MKGNGMGQSLGLRSSVDKLSLEKLVFNKFSVSIFERMFMVGYMCMEFKFYKGILRFLMQKFEKRS